MRRPLFFLVGAPKSGTTSLDRYLRRHPELFMARKELHFFGADFAYPRAPRTEEEYLAHFAAAADHQKPGESSVWYLYSRRAAEEIHRFEPEARIVVLLRDPTEMVPSLHSELLFSGDETLQDLEAALDAEPARRSGGLAPGRPAGLPVQSLFYSDVARFSEQVSRYLDAFGRARVHVELFDDLSSDPRGVCARTARFLGVDAAFEPAVGVVNPNKVVRFPKLMRFRHGYPAWLARTGRLVLPSLKLRRLLMAAVERAYTRRRPRPPLSESTRRRIWSLVADDVRRLEGLIDRDLSAWGPPR